MGTVTTNHHARPLLSWWELDEDDRVDFNYVDEDDQTTTRFVQYRGSWYDVDDTIRIDVAPNNRPFGHNVQPDSPLAAWDSIATDSSFSGVVFRYPTQAEAYERDIDQYEYIIVGTWTS